MVPPEELDQYPRPRFRRYFLLPAAITLAIVALITVLRPASEDEQTDPQTLPRFNLPLLAGGTLGSEDLQGKPIVLNLWASWCGPCKEEAPAFERLWRKHKGHGLQIVGVNTQDNDRAARAFVEEHGITYPVVRDADGKLRRALTDFDGLPQTFFVTADGRFLSSGAGDEVGSRGSTTVLGALSEEDLEARIQELLAANP